MPEAAKAHTKAGAKAFVEHFWQVVNYAQATGDTDALSVLTVPECTTCAAGIESIREVHSGGGKIVGGEAALSDLSVAVSEQHSTHLATVTFQAHFAAQTTDYPGTRRDKTNIARRARDQFHLIAAGDSPWRVATFRVLQ